MRLVRPQDITPEKLSTTNVESIESDWVAGSYSVGDRVAFGEYIYEALEATSDQPDEGYESNPQTWARLGTSNKWRMFRQGTDSKTSNPGTIDVNIKSGQAVGTVAALGVVGSSVRVVIEAPEGWEPPPGFEPINPEYDFFTSVPYPVPIRDALNFGFSIGGDHSMVPTIRTEGVEVDSLGFGFSVGGGPHELRDVHRDIEIDTDTLGFGFGVGGTHELRDAIRLENIGTDVLGFGFAIGGNHTLTRVVIHHTVERDDLGFGFTIGGGPHELNEA